MNRTMTTATNTINQLQKQFDIVSHNIANAQTTGFKSKEVSFAEMMVQEINNQSSRQDETGRLSPGGIRQGVGAMISKSSLLLQQGPLTTTDRALDIAFTSKDQFLKIRLGDEIAYTRNGALYLSPVENNEVMLVNQDGHSVLDENNQPIVFSNELTNYTIFPNGALHAAGENGGQAFANLGVIALHRPQIMEQKGDTLIGLPNNLEPEMNVAAIFTELTGAARNEISIQQRSLEESNVDMAKEMTNMIQIQRSLQFQSRAISISDQMMGLINGIR
ncbi:flagellar hook-basal body protein [Pseudogracilibacillus auburnensis]|uniref:flagellar hook-basal body protein n=1 Tax=Pseudogracilibacillus auburnensis TaxID=1494959 RepID=UPI001A966E0B|nr:flagellar hook-basal body protein [Pseudogracilibacillus auburnensis]MBO1004776.1 flagellar hook-basal body protein [Pseudogracilibacillus auburnensis]